MQESEQPLLGESGTAANGSTQALSADEVWRLTLFKWRYSLEASGFNSGEVRQLMFHKWRAQRLKAGS